MSSQTNFNSSTHFDSSTKTFVDKSKDKTALDISSDPNNCGQTAKKSGTKDAAGLKSWSQVFKQMFTRKEIIVDGIEDSSPIRRTASLGQNDELEGLDSMDPATNVLHSRALPETETSHKEDDTTLKSSENGAGCPKAYSRDFLLSFQSHPLAMQRPQSNHPLVTLKVDERVLQMLKHFPEDFSKTDKGWAQECLVHVIIKQLMSNAVEIPKEPVQSCCVLGLLALKHEYD